MTLKSVKHTGSYRLVLTGINGRKLPDSEIFPPNYILFTDMKGVMDPGYVALH